MSFVPSKNHIVLGWRHMATSDSLSNAYFIHFSSKIEKGNHVVKSLAGKEIALKMVKQKREQVGEIPSIYLTPHH